MESISHTRIKEERVALKITAIYLAIGAVWVIFSNEFLSLLVDDPSALSRLQVLQGWIYVLATAGMLHMLIYRNMLRLRSSEEALTERKARLRAMVSGFDGLICVWADNGIIEFMNEQLIEVVGHDATGERYADVFLSKKYGLEAILAPDEVFRGRTIRTEIKDRQTGRWYFAVYSPITHVDGGVSAMSMLLDVTERQVAESALRESESKNRAILNAIPDLMFQLDDQGVFVDYHAAQDDHLLVKPEDFLGKRASDVLPPYLSELIQRHVTEAFKTRKIQVFDYAVGEGDEKKHYETRLVVNGEDRVLCMCRDVTEHRRAEESCAQLARAVEHAAEAIIIADTDGLIQYVNPSFQRITGYKQDEVEGRNTRFLMSDKHSKSLSDDMVEGLARNGVWTGHVANSRKDGSPYEADVALSPIRDRDDHIVNYVAVFRDVTHEVELEKQFLQAQRMDSVGRLAGGIAHDFNNLLLSILGVSEMILDEVEDTHPIRKDVQEIIQAGESAAQLTRQLLALGRKQQAKLETLRLDEVIQKLEPLFKHALAKGIQCTTKVDDDLPLVQADAAQIEQVLMNLVVNARDALPEGGEITIETGRAILDEDYCRSHIEVTPGEYAVLRVRDTGDGMPEEVKLHAFEPFFSTKGEDKGSGLGLATVYGIVQQHGGCIELQSQPGVGTEFKIYFPCAKEKVSN